MEEKGKGKRIIEKLIRDHKCDKNLVTVIMEKIGLTLDEAKELLEWKTNVSAYREDLKEQAAKPNLPKEKKLVNL